LLSSLVICLFGKNVWEMTYPTYVEWNVISQLNWPMNERLLYHSLLTCDRTMLLTYCSSSVLSVRWVMCLASPHQYCEGDGLG